MRGRTGARAGRVARGCVGLGVGIVMLAAPGPGEARAEGRLVNLELFAPAADSKGLVTVDRAELLGHLHVSFGLWASYARNPLIVPDGAGEPFPLVRNLVTAHLHAAVGLFGRAEVAVLAPVGILEGPRDTEARGLGPRVATHGLGDPSVKLKGAILDRRRHGIGLGVLAGLRFPGGGAGRELMTSGRVELYPRILVDGRVGPVALAANAGANLVFGSAPGAGECCAGAGTAAAGAGAFAVGHELTAGVGAAIALVPDRLELVLEANGRLGLTGSGDRWTRTPIEALAALKVYVAKSSFLVVGASWGVSRLFGPSYGAPEPRAFVGITYEPVRRDGDGDGREDGADACPDEAEDFDGFEDGDGCLDPDDDVDGVLDVDDGCPREAEDLDGDRDLDGCREDPARVKRVAGKFVTLEKIHFEHDRAVIEPASYGLLYDIGRALNDNPQVRLLRVEGHTDSDGSDAYNLRLSAARAKVVRDFLVERADVSGERLVSDGYGERRPVATNETEEGKAANRRVELVILEEETPGAR